MEIQTSLNPSLDKSHNKSAFLKHTCDREFMTITCSHCGHKHQVLWGVRDRTCSLCARDIYEEIYARYEKFVSTRKDLKFLTLTWKPVSRQDPNIVRQIGKALVKLRHRKKYAKAWKGILATLECKKTNSGFFYYHIHCIIEGNYIPQKEISEDWAKISGFKIVHIERIWRTPARAFRYILKYVLKGFAFENEEDVLDFKSSMKGVRYLRSYGDFYNFQYQTAKHVLFPCPDCGGVKCWILEWDLDWYQMNGWEPGG
jgi:Replication protein.